MLDCQAPDVKVVADGDDDIDDEASIDADCGTEHAEHEGDLVDTVAEGRGPTYAGNGAILQEDGANRINDTKGEWDHDDVPVREIELHEVSGNHLANAVGVDNAGEENEGHEMVVKNVGLQRKVEHHESPGNEEWGETDESITATVAASTARFDDVAG